MGKFVKGNKVKFISHGVIIKGIITDISYGQGGGIATVKSWRGHFLVKEIELKTLEERFEGISIRGNK